MVFPDPGPSVGPGGRKVNRGRLSISNFQMKPGKSTDIQKSCNLPKLHQAWSEREILCFPELREPAAHWEPRVKRLLPSHPSSNAGPAAPAPPAGPSPRFRGGTCEEAFTQGRLRPPWPLLVTLGPPGLPSFTRSSLLWSVIRRQ